VTSSSDDLFVDHGLEILSEAECRHLLAQAAVGRVAVVRDGVAAIFPVNYGMVGGDVVFFTGEGTKLVAAQEGALVSFEVDVVDLDERLGWSVLVVGMASLASPSATRQAEAVGVYPWAAGGRSRAVRIRPEMITGRRICS
jgi:nitroimidazol reductase NimA-like FMN-containing flavoprotein (pyridoxamine 5'-phosphate oxidase superfamily)